MIIGVTVTVQTEGFSDVVNITEQVQDAVTQLLHSTDGQTVEQLPHPLHRAVLIEQTCLPFFQIRLGAL